MHDAEKNTHKNTWKMKQLRRPRRAAAFTTLLLSLPGTYSFTPCSPQAHFYRPSITRLHSSNNNNNNNNPNRFDQELEQKAELKARQSTTKSGGGETLAGAVLGGLVLGPFGALFGASLGSSLGQGRAIDEAKQKELDRLGITQEMLVAAREVGVALERAMEGLEATEDSLVTQQKFAKRLNANVEELMEKAQVALTDGKEDVARDFLFQKREVQEKLKKSLISCAEEKKRLETMKANVRSIEGRAVEMEALMKRNMGAKALMDSSSTFALEVEDPLLKKFKDLGID